MTTHTHDAPEAEPPTRSRWLVPALAVGAIAIALVLAGVVSFWTVLYAGMFGGMMLMHLGGHGGSHDGPTAKEGSGDDPATRRGGCH